MARKYMQGNYRVQNREKYVGNINNITYRSSWELTMLRRFDLDENVIQFSSEETIIPYRDINGVLRRYFVDFKIKRKVGDKVITELIEVKPYKETIPPVLTEGKKTKTKIREILTWDINSRKWEAARKYCDKMGWNFVIMTENEIPGLGKKRK